MQYRTFACQDAQFLATLMDDCIIAVKGCYMRIKRVHQRLMLAHVNERKRLSSKKKLPQQPKICFLSHVLKMAPYLNLHQISLYHFHRNEVFTPRPEHIFLLKPCCDVILVSFCSMQHNVHLPLTIALRKIGFNSVAAFASLSESR